MDELSIDHAQERVAAFMKAGGQKVRATPMNPSYIPEDELVLRIELGKEEQTEWVLALASSDLTEAVDAIADRLVILLGDANALGVRVAPILREVLRSNDTKIDWTANPPRPFAVRDDGKIMKTEAFEEPQIKAELERQANVRADD